MIKLSEISTKAPSGMNEKETKKHLLELASDIGDLQHVMYAEGKKSLLFYKVWTQVVKMVQLKMYFMPVIQLG
jgi:hypothetical protein